jgi:hypothetical protein
LIELFLFVFTNALVVLLVLFIAQGEKTPGPDSLGMFAFKEELPEQGAPSDSTGQRNA